MTRAVLYFVVLLLSIDSVDKNFDNPVSSFTVADTVQVELNVLYDSLGLPDRFVAQVITPVCENDKCYEIEIDLYWDLIGRFIHYDTIPEKGLTKLDHVPFTKADYSRLHEILASRNSLLSSYTKEELIKNTRSSELDGITGATVQEIKESVINGAVYSCYTLWHIANGPVEDSIKNVTASMFNKDLVKKLVDQEDQEVNYFLINQFSHEEFDDFLPEVLRMIENGEGYFAKNAIELMPEEIIMYSQSQDFFAIHFNKLNYFSQVALLRKLNKRLLEDELKLTLQNSLDNRNSYKNDLILELIDN